MITTGERDETPGDSICAAHAHASKGPTTRSRKCPVSLFPAINPRKDCRPTALKPATTLSAEYSYELERRREKILEKRIDRLDLFLKSVKCYSCVTFPVHLTLRINRNVLDAVGI